MTDGPHSDRSSAGPPAGSATPSSTRSSPTGSREPARVAKPGPMETWDAPPTVHGFKGGDLLGIVERLDELADLGVTALYLTPIFSSASNHRYHTYDYLAVDPLLGGDDALRELLDAPTRGACGSCSTACSTTAAAASGRSTTCWRTALASPYVDWFHLDRERLASGRGLDAYPDRAAPHPDGRRPRGHSEADSLERLGYRGWWDMPALPKLNTDHPAVREYLWSVAEHWLRFGIDGWRLDVPAEIDDEAFWQEFRRRCRAVNPDAYLVGEIWDVAPEWVRGDRFDALMNYPLLEAILGFVGGPSLDTALVASHHELSMHVRPSDADGVRVGGPRAGRGVRAGDGRRPAQPALAPTTCRGCGRSSSGDLAAVRLATLLQMTLPGAPCVYYGDEIGMEGGNDPDCRRSFPVGADGRDEALRATFRDLIALRHAHPALRADGLRVVGAVGACVALLRGGAADPTSAGETLVVLVNAGTEPASIVLAIPELAGRRLVPLEVGGLPAGSPVAIAEGGRASMEIAARSGSVLAAVG